MLVTSRKPKKSRLFFAVFSGLVSILIAADPFSLALKPPNLRLPHDVEPVRSTLDLNLDPKADTFTGVVTIDLRVVHSTDHFWVNATDITITKSHFVQAGKTIQANLVPGGEDFVGFQFATRLSEGAAQLELTYRGKVNLRSSEGLFRSEEHGDSYLFTQFEPLDARRAFPCFDEPSFKIPWQLTLRVPQELVAVSNTGIDKETALGSGIKLVRFKETKPLPSYLIAFAVGHLEFVDGGTAGAHHVPVHIVLPRGDANRAKYAASVSGEILTRLEHYFGIPYPYDKADQVAIPLSFGGAMENPGLVTYDANILLSPPGGDTTVHQRRYVEFAAHELAHQWFGDMVTMAWWNDVWLNESFATWMSAKLIADWKPEWNTKAENQDARLTAINADTKASARRINQPAESKSDIGDAFDGITYEKGGSVLAMFENAIGPKAFQEAIHDYLVEHMFANATAEDFLSALAKKSNQNEATAFSTFLNQNGVPELTVKLDCSRQETPSLHISQTRLLPIGSEGSRNALWEIPICAAFSSGGRRQQVCHLLAKPNDEMKLPATGCPDWALANAQEVGYYQVVYPKQMLDALLNHRDDLTLEEQVGLLGDLNALTDAGRMPFDQALALVPKLANDPRRLIAEAAVELASVPSEFVPADLRGEYSKFVEQNFGRRARALGWQPKLGESEDQVLFRPTLLSFVAKSAEDPELTRTARELTDKWLRDRHVVAPEVSGIMLNVAAEHGDEELYNRLLAAAKAEHDPYFRPILIRALGHFRSPKLVERSLRLATDGTFDIRMSMTLLFAPTSEQPVSHLPYDYLKQQYATVLEKLPTGIGTDYAARLPEVARSWACSDADYSDVQRFFESRMKSVQGGPRSLAETLESIRLCAAQRPAAQEAMRNFFKPHSNQKLASDLREGS
jgi:alanyl aminopeptidase